VPVQGRCPAVEQYCFRQSFRPSFGLVSWNRQWALPLTGPSPFTTHRSWPYTHLIRHSFTSALHSLNPQNFGLIHRRILDKLGQHTKLTGWNYEESSLQGCVHAGLLADFFLSSTLKIEAIRSSETSVNTTSTRRHIQEDCFLHSHLRENLKSYILAGTILELQVSHKNVGASLLLKPQETLFWCRQIFSLIATALTLTPHTSTLRPDSEAAALPLLQWLTKSLACLWKVCRYVQTFFERQGEIQPTQSNYMKCAKSYLKR
jgi:hypothetical protein